MKIVFVCTGNTCRSPMAESIAKAKIPDIEVASRGLFALDGTPTSEHTRAILKEKQLPIPDNAQQFTEMDMHADLILTMSRSHRDAIKQTCWVNTQIFTLSSYVLQGDDMSDPVGVTKSEYIEIYNELKSLIETLKNKRAEEIQM